MAATATAAEKKSPTTKRPVAAIEHQDNAVLLASDGGRTTIQPHVVAKIAGLAVREVPGVRALVPFGTGQAISSIARAVTGSQMRDLGVSVEVGKVEAAVDVRITTDYGVSIPSIAQGVRDNVSVRIHEMTGLRVTEVNIEVVDLYFDDDEVEATPRRVQ
jgi:uncharacterized alkaline shock family protein YloU